MPKTAIELGCSDIRIYIQEKGIFIKEPAVAAVRLTDRSVFAAGAEAESLFLKAPGSAQKLYPLADDYISSFDAVMMILKKYIKSSAKNPHTFYIAVGNHISENEKKRISESMAESFGKTDTVFVSSVYASALGSGIVANDGKFRIAAEMCESFSNITVMNGYSVTKSFCLPVGTSGFALAAEEKIYKTYGVKISEKQAKALTENFLSVAPMCECAVNEISGTDIKYKLTKKIKLRSDMLCGAGFSAADIFSDALTSVIAELPENAPDITQNGCILLGDGTFVRGLPEYVFNKTGIRLHPASDGRDCVIKGMRMILDEGLPVPDIKSDGSVPSLVRREKISAIFDFTDIFPETNEETGKAAEAKK